MCKHRISLTKKEIAMVKEVYPNFSYSPIGVRVGSLIQMNFRLDHARRCIKCRKLIKYVRKPKEVRVG